MTPATPSSSGPGHVRSATARRRGCASLDGKPERRRSRAARRRSRRRRTRSRGRDRARAAAATNARPDPFVTPGFPSSSMYGSEVVRNMRPAKRCFEPAANVGEDGRLGDDDELRRRAARATRAGRRPRPREGAGTPCTGASTRSRARRRAGRRRTRSVRCRATRARRSPRARPRARAARAGGTRPFADRRRPRPGSRRPAPRAPPRRGSASPSGTCGRSPRARGSPPPWARAIAARVRGPSCPSGADERPVEVAWRTPATAPPNRSGRRLSRPWTTRRTAPRRRSAAARAGP